MPYDGQLYDGWAVLQPPYIYSLEHLHVAAGKPELSGIRFFRARRLQGGTESIYLVSDCVPDGSVWQYWERVAQYAAEYADHIDFRIPNEGTVDLTVVQREPLTLTLEEVLRLQPSSETPRLEEFLAHLEKHRIS